MANISISPPSTYGTTNNYGGIIGLSAIPQLSQSSEVVQVDAAASTHPGVSVSIHQAASSDASQGRDIGLSEAGLTDDQARNQMAAIASGTWPTVNSSLSWGAQVQFLYWKGSLSAPSTGTLSNFTWKTVAENGGSNYITYYGVSYKCATSRDSVNATWSAGGSGGSYTMNLRNRLSNSNISGHNIAGTVLNLYGQVTTISGASGTLYYPGYQIDSTVYNDVYSYTFYNNTGSSIVIEGTSIANSASSVITPAGLVDIIYNLPGELVEETTTQVTTQAITTVVAPVYVYGTGATGFGTGLTGYFYPLYTDINASALSAGYHVHTFTEYVGYTFYMPNGSMNHAVSSRPTGTDKFFTGIAELDNLEPIIGNPDYATLLPQINAETDPVKKQALIDQCYQFIVPLTQAEEDLFAHINNDYVENNPNSTDGTPATFISHVGVYYDDIGRTTGTPEAQQLTVVVAEIDETAVATGLIAEYGIGEYGVNEYDG